MNDTDRKKNVAHAIWTLIGHPLARQRVADMAGVSPEDVEVRSINDLQAHIRVRTPQGIHYYLVRVSEQM